MEITQDLIRNTMDLLAAMSAAQIAADLSITNTQALAGLLSSETGEMLYDEECRLWWEGPSAIAQMYEEEIA